jgi:hypothetical protein
LEHQKNLADSTARKTPMGNWKPLPMRRNQWYVMSSGSPEREGHTSAQETLIEDDSDKNEEAEVIVAQAMQGIDVRAAELPLQEEVNSLLPI